jgi:Immunoglobulin I-set domain
MLRFAAEAEQGSTGLGGSDGGWFIDDIRLINVQETGAPTAVASVPTGTSFTFTPPELGDYLLSTRAQVFGNFFTDWSAYTIVKTTTPVAPVIRQHPIYTSASSGGTAEFTTVADGAATLAYQWKRNGTDVPESATRIGTNTAKLRLNNLTQADAGTYTVTVSNGSGTQTSQSGELYVSPPAMELPRSLDMPGQSFSSIPGTSWTNGHPPAVEASPPLARARRSSGNANPATAIISHDGEDSARTGNVGHSESANMETTLSGPAVVSFWWRVDSEPGHDFLHCQLDGTTLYSISGLVDWEERLVYIPAGDHQLRWRYSKDANTSCGMDAGWVDQVGYIDEDPLDTLATATGSTGIRWSSTGDASWITSDELVRSGTAARSGLIDDDQESRMEAKVMGPAELSFYWELDAEAADTLTFEMDGVTLLTKTQTLADEADSDDEVTFNDDWEQQTVTIPAGLHRISWVYRKDSSESEGLDAAYVDDVILTPGTPGLNGQPAPVIGYSMSGSKLRLTWPAAATAYELQSSPTLSGWQNVPTAGIFSADGENSIVVETTAAPKWYYRLAPKP